MSHKSASQECAARLSHKHQSVARECPTRVPCKSAPQECPTESHKSAPQEFCTRVADKSVLQLCLTRASSKSVPQECTSRASHKRLAHQSVVRDLRTDHLALGSTHVGKLWPQNWQLCSTNAQWEASALSPSPRSTSLVWEAAPGSSWNGSLQHTCSTRSSL